MEELRARNYSTILNKLDRELEILENRLDEVNKKPSVAEQVDGLFDLAEEVEIFVRSWRSYTQTYNSLMENVEESNTKLTAENHELRGQLTLMQQELERMIKVVENTSQTKEDLILRACDIMDDFESSVENKTDVLAQSWAFTRKLKEGQKKGKEHPHYRQDVNNEELIADYVANNHKISKQMVSKYGLTYQGLKSRLQSLGAYKERR